jgi:hypothetical protein
VIRALPALLLALTHSACATHRAGPPRRDATYEIAVVAAVGARTVTEHYAVRTAPAAAQAWRVHTAWTDSRVEDVAGPIAFDSRAPTRADPWPLVSQHAVASIPATVHFDARGRPDAILDAEGWAANARVAVRSLDLPEQAVRSGLALVDAEGLLRDLIRVFPGAPRTHAAAEAEWSRPLRLAGVELPRVERCEAVVAEGLTTWTCEGPLALPAGGSTLVHEGESWSTLVLDRRGLRSFEEGWSGTLVQRDGGGLRDQPFAGRRLVQRQ